MTSVTPAPTRTISIVKDSPEVAGEAAPFSKPTACLANTKYGEQQQLGDRW